MKKLWKKLLAGASSLALLATMLPPAAIVSADGPAEPITLSKTAAHVAGTANRWTVTLNVKGSNVTTNPSADIVLVMDRSGSMKDSDGKSGSTKISSARKSAVSFVQGVLTAGHPNAKVALVSFSGDVKVDSGLVGYPNVSAITNAVNGLTASGGTDIQAALHQAQGLLNESDAAHKYIVLLTDGEPTYSYKGSNLQPVPGSTAGQSYSQYLTNFDYSKQLGNGRNYTLDGYSYQVGDKKDSPWVINNGMGTFSEAQLAKDAGYTLFTIGYGLGSGDTTAINLLKAMASSTDDYKSADTSSIGTVLNGVLQSITQAVGTAGTVTDPIGPEFTLVPESITAGAGTSATYDSASRTITWNIGTLDAATDATLTYTVQISDDAVSGQLYPTNGTTTLNYTDVGGKPQHQDFNPIPQVCVYGYTVNYYVGGSLDHSYTRRAAEGSTVGYDSFTPPAGYSFSHTAPVSGQLTISQDTGANVLNVYYAPNKYGYTVNYLGTDGVQLDKTTGTADYGTTVEGDTSKSFTGYTYSNVNPGSVTIGTDAGKNVVNVYYAPNQYGYTVNYLGTDGVQLDKTAGTADYGTTVSGNTAKTFTGYTYSSVNPGSVTIGTDAGKNVVNVYYTPNQANYTVHYYVQGTTKSLVSDKLVNTGKTNETVSESAVDVAGYTVVGSDTQSLKLSTGENVITFYYTPNQASYTVHYYVKDTTTSLVTDKLVNTGKTDETVSESAVDVAGYTVVGSDTQSLKLGTGENVITFYYAPNQYGYTVNYLGTDGAQLDKTAGTADYGTTVSGDTSKSFTGYTYSNVNPGSVTIGTDAGKNVVNVYYAPNQYGYTVNYLGTDGVQLDKTAGTADYGTTVEGDTAKTFTGYTYSSVDPGSVTIGTDAGKNVVNVYYAPKTETYVVHYVDDATGKSVLADKTGTGLFGSTVTEKAPAIDGYTNLSADSVTITLAESGNEITFHYAAVVVIPDDDTPAAEAPDTTPTVTVDDNEVPLSENPKTGNPVLPFAGLAIGMAGIGGAAAAERMRRKKHRR